jgi:RND family efflux transporter MFP subunit
VKKRSNIALKIVLPILVLFVGNATAVMLFFSGPEAKKKEQRKHIPLVEVQALKAQDYTLSVRSSGKVNAKTETRLIAEISGRITKLSDNFEAGNQLNQQAVLVQLDDSDYQNALTIARAEVEKATLALKEEQAKANAAQKDWRLLDRDDRPSELVSRRAHVANAKSALSAAKANLEQTQKNLNRTLIQMPYNGRILERKVNIGQYITAGTEIGTIYSEGELEVHLPISLTQNDQLNLKNNKPTVEYTMTLGKNTQTWSGKVLRSSASLDPSTNQLTLIGSIDTSNQPVKIGQFVRANISGKTFKDIYVLPRSAIRKNQEILLVENGKVKIHPVKVVHTEGNQAIVEAELSDKARAITTPMPLAKNGLEVRVKGDKPQKKKGEGKEKPAKKPETTEEK